MHRSDHDSSKRDGRGSTPKHQTAKSPTQEDLAHEEGPAHDREASEASSRNSEGKISEGTSDEAPDEAPDEAASTDENPPTEGIKGLGSEKLSDFKELAKGLLEIWTGVPHTSEEKPNLVPPATQEAPDPASRSDPDVQREMQFESGNAEDPGAQKADPEESNAEGLNAEELDPHVGRMSYVEFALQIAKFCPQGNKKTAPKAAQIYHSLESSLIKEIGVTNIGSSFLLDITPRKPKKEDGKWRSSPTLYTLHKKLRQTWAMAKKIGIDNPIVLARATSPKAAAGANRTDSRDHREGRKRLEPEDHPRKTSNAEEPHTKRIRPGRVRQVQTRLLETFQQPEEAGSQRPEEPGSNPEETRCSNGLPAKGDSHPSDAASDDSDGTTSVDASAVTPSDKPSDEPPEESPVEKRCTRDQWRWLVAESRHTVEQLLFLHLIEASRRAAYSVGSDGRWTVVPAEELYERFGACYPTEVIWRHSDLIEARRGGQYISPQEAEATGKEPKARELRVKAGALEHWTYLGEKGGSPRYKAHRRELVRSHQPEPMSTDLRDENQNQIPSLVRESLKVLAAADHRGVFEAIEDGVEALLKRDGEKARHQLASLYLAKETIARQIVGKQSGIVRLKNAYTIQKSSGRIAFKRGGPQCLNAEVKARFYDVDGYRNFDIRSCHTQALKQLTDILSTKVGVSVDPTPWTEYPGKQAVAERWDLPVSLIKFTEHAIKYGAVLPASLKQLRGFYMADSDENDLSLWPSIPREVRRHVEKGSVEDISRALCALESEFREMREVVLQISEALLTDYYAAEQSGGWMENACGISFGKHAFDEGFERRSKCMAWMLQGLEAAFCHSLTIASADSEAFSVVANEHDGLIIQKEVASEADFQDALDAAIDDARDRSGFYRASIVEKPFAEEEAVAEFYGEDGAM
ncbi:hypothetical protein [Salinibacter ruber]|uniref:hypothetical protein n=1 Tax=Salinibacter ruber TaxID=146919 RepID=UPI002167EB24|nr:hypothetical protein [Salinibacter ruber]MCS4152298.1 hypothetical protein [Salinibacter ruber]